VKLLSILDAECAEMHEALDSSSGCRCDQRLSPSRIDAQEVCALLPVARERHKVHDGVAASEGGGERCGIRDVTDARRQARRMGHVSLRDRRCNARGSRERHDLMASLQECRENVTSNKARPAREKDSRHFYPLLLLAQTL
jgi:hypothetical protein